MGELLYEAMYIGKHVVLVSALEFIIFFLLTAYSTRGSLSFVWKSYGKAYGEALICSFFMLVVIIGMKYDSSTNYQFLFEQIFGWLLFLSLVLMLSIHFESFRKSKYSYAFFALCMLIMALLFLKS